MFKLTKGKEDWFFRGLILIIICLLWAFFSVYAHSYELNEESYYDRCEDTHTARDMQYQMDKIRLDQERMRLQQEMDRLRQQNGWDYN